MARPLPSDAGPADKFGAMLPAEVTGLYVSIRALFEAPSTPNPLIWMTIFAILSLMTAIVYIRYFRKVTNSIHLLIYAILFVSWVIALDVKEIQQAMLQYLHWNVPLSAIMGATSIILSILVPIVIPSPTIASEGAVGA